MSAILKVSLHCSKPHSKYLPFRMINFNDEFCFRQDVTVGFDRKYLQSFEKRYHTMRTFIFPLHMFMKKVLDPTKSLELINNRNS